MNNVNRNYENFYFLVNNSEILDEILKTTGDVLENPETSQNNTAPIIKDSPKVEVAIPALSTINRALFAEFKRVISDTAYPTDEEPSKEIDIAEFETTRLQNLKQLQEKVLKEIEKFESTLTDAQLSRDLFDRIYSQSYFYTPNCIYGSALIPKNFNGYKPGHPLYSTNIQPRTTLYKVLGILSVAILMIEDSYEKESKIPWNSRLSLSEMLENKVYKGRFDKLKKQKYQKVHSQNTGTHSKIPLPRIPLIKPLALEKSNPISRPTFTERQNPNNNLDPLIQNLKESLEEEGLWDDFINQIQLNNYQDIWWKKFSDLLYEIIEWKDSTYVIEVSEIDHDWQKNILDSINAGHWGDISFVYILCERLFGSRYSIIVIPEGNPNSYYNPHGELEPLSNLERPPLCRIVWTSASNNSTVKNHFEVEFNGERIKIPGDGHCLYRSFATAVKCIVDQAVLEIESPQGPINKNPPPKTPESTSSSQRISTTPRTSSTKTTTNKRPPIQLDSVMTPIIKLEENPNGIALAKAKTDAISKGSQLGNQDALLGYPLKNFYFYFKDHLQQYSNEMRDVFIRSYQVAYQEVTSETKAEYADQWAIKQGKQDRLNGINPLENSQLERDHPHWDKKLLPIIYKRYKEAYDSVTSNQILAHAAELGERSGYAKAYSGSLEPSSERNLRILCKKDHPLWSTEDIADYIQNHRTSFAEKVEIPEEQALRKAKTNVNNNLRKTGLEKTTSSYTGEKRNFTTINDWDESTRTTYKREYLRFETERDISNCMAKYGYKNPFREDSVVLVFEHLKDASQFYKDLGPRITKANLLNFEKIGIFCEEKFVEIRNYTYLIEVLKLEAEKFDTIDQLPNEHENQVKELFGISHHFEDPVIKIESDEEPIIKELIEDDFIEEDFEDGGVEPHSPVGTPEERMIKQEPLIDFEPKDQIEEEPPQIPLSPKGKKSPPQEQPQIVGNLTLTDAINTLHNLLNDPNETIVSQTLELLKNGRATLRNMQSWETIKNHILIAYNQKRSQELVCWKTLLWSKFRLSNYKDQDAIEIFSLMNRCGMADIASYEELLSAQAALKNLPEIAALLLQIKNKKLVFSERMGILLNKLLIKLLQKRYLETADFLYDTLKTHSLVSETGYASLIETYRQIKTYRQINSLDRALKFCSELIETNIPPSALLFKSLHNLLLQYKERLNEAQTVYEKCNRLVDLEKLFSIIDESRYRNRRAHSIRIEAYLELGYVENAIGLIDEMRACNFPEFTRSVRTLYYKILRLYIHQPLNKMKALENKIVDEWGIPVTEVYCNYIQNYTENGQLKEAAQILKELNEKLDYFDKKAGIESMELLKALVAKKEIEMCQELFNTIEAKVDQRIYGFMLKTYLDHKQTANAVSVVKKMFKANLWKKEYNHFLDDLKAILRDIREMQDDYKWILSLLK